MTIKLTDFFSVESQPLRTVADAAAADFQVDLLAGRLPDATRDVYREFPFPVTTKVFGTRRLGETMAIDFHSPEEGGTWRVMGGADVISMDEDLTALSTITAGPAGTGIYKALVPIGDKGPRYFVRLESR